MINLTLNVVFKKEGKELEQAIIKAVRETRKLLFDKYSGGKTVPNEKIVSSTKVKTPTRQLAFCKFFNEVNIGDVEIPWEEFIVICQDINRLGSKNLPKAEFSKVIPYFQNVRSMLSAIFLSGIKRGISILLMSLWYQDAIILPANYKLPVSHDGYRGKKTMLCKLFFSEVLFFFQNYRGEYCTDKNRVEPIKVELSISLQKQMQSYAWRMILSTDWHKVENVCEKEAVSFLKAIQEHKEKKRVFIVIPVPVREMLLLLKEHFDERTRYSLSDFQIARDRAFGLSTMDATYSPNALLHGPWLSDIVGFDLKTASLEWVRTQVKYINQRKKHGMKTYAGIAKSLTILNQYLFFILPRHIDFSKESSDYPLTEIRSFSRIYLDGDDKIPSFIDYLESARSVETNNGHFSKIDHYFDYLEASSTAGGPIEGFKNPIVRTIDFSKSKARKGTNKNIVSRLHFSPMLSYFYAVEQFISYIIDTLLCEDSSCPKKQAIIEENRQKIKVCIESIPSRYGAWVDTETFGFVPFIYYLGKAYPVTRIQSSIFSLSNRKTKNHGWLKLPNPTHLFQVIIAFETGIRNIHILWLDSYSYDNFIDRKKPLEPICKLVVNTDKVRSEAWTSYVSCRVIQLLDKLRFFNTQMDELWGGRCYWYDGHVESPFGKINSLFKRGGVKRDGGMPSTNSTYTEKFRKILLSFQVFSNTNELFDQSLNFVTVREVRNNSGKIERNFHSGITPHSARATLVSHNIHLLPHWVIGKYLTGHESEAVVAYYAVVDVEYLKLVGTSQEHALNGSHFLLDEPDDAHSIKADEVNSQLKQAIDQRMEDTFATYGATSFDRELSDGKVESGISIALNNGSAQIALNSTHMCPYNNICPKDVLEDIGEMQCGQCWASIKTVDHLPRISAHIRELHARIEEKTASINIMITQGVSDRVLEGHDLLRIKLAAEESAWITTHILLENFRQDMSKRERYLVAKPDIVEKHLERVVTDSSPLTNILQRIRDAKDYPEYLTPQLIGSITKLRNMILAKAGNIDKIIRQPDDYELLDEFRGIIRSICDTTNLNLEDLSRQLSEELSPGNISLLELF